MDSDALVSIITPSCNSAPFIGATIESVLSQTYTDWELIIVDDCSSDNTMEIARHYADRDRRIRLHILDTNSGAAVARNTALAMARGRWVAFLDSDDIWTPEKLETQIRFMTENGFSFSYHPYSEIDEKGNPTGTRVSGPKCIGRLGMLAYCWPGCLTVMYDRKKLGELSIYPIRKNNDYAMWLQLSKRAACHLLPRDMAFYRRRSGSISNHGWGELVKWHYRLFREAEGHSVPISLILTGQNLFFGVLKKLFYKK